MPYRRPKCQTWYYDFQIDGRRFCGSCETANFKEAKKVEAKARVAAATAPPEAPVSFTVEQALGTYWTDVSQFQTSSRTTLSQSHSILAALPTKLALTEMQETHLLQLKAHYRKRKQANGTINRALQLLGRAIRHMEKHGAAKVALDFRKAELKEPEERIKELTWDEQDRLFSNLRLDLHPFVKFALMTGARRASITELRWKDVDLVNNKIRFDTKGGSQQNFPINSELRAFLTALPRSKREFDSAYVLTFVDEQTGERRKVNKQGGAIHRSFHKATIAAKIEDFRFHDLRHTFATRVLRQQQNLKVVQKLLGHSSVETTTRYAHVLDEDLRDAMAGFSMIKSVAFPKSDEPPEKSRATS